MVAKIDLEKASQGKLGFPAINFGRVRAC